MDFSLERRNSTIEAALILGNMDIISKSARCGLNAHQPTMGGFAVCRRKEHKESRINIERVASHERHCQANPNQRFKIPLAINTTLTERKVKQLLPISKNYFRAIVRALLERSEMSNIISWEDDGRSWRVHQIKVFERYVIPTIFPQMSSYASFLSLAKTHGFKIIRSNSAEWFYDKDFSLEKCYRNRSNEKYSTAQYLKKASKKIASTKNNFVPQILQQKPLLKAEPNFLFHHIKQVKFNTFSESGRGGQKSDQNMSKRYVTE